MNKELKENLVEDHEEAREVALTSLRQVEADHQTQILHVEPAPQKGYFPNDYVSKPMNKKEFEEYLEVQRREHPTRSRLYDLMQKFL